MFDSFINPFNFKIMPPVIRVEIVALMPTQAGCALFLGDGQKVILIYIDPAIGMAINIAMTNETLPRPMTHDLYMHTLQAFGAKVQRVIINESDGEVFHARLILEAVNEISHRKIVEIDARPSDCLAIAARSGAPIYVAKNVWDQTEDRSNLLDEMRDGLTDEH